jgi:hypothetical protein
MTGQYSIIWTYHIIFINSSVDGILGWFQSIAVVNSCTIDMSLHIWVCWNYFFRYTHKKRGTRRGRKIYTIPRPQERINLGRKTNKQMGTKNQHFSLNTKLLRWIVSRKECKIFKQKIKQEFVYNFQ